MEAEELKTDSNHTPEGIKFTVTSDLESVSDNFYENYSKYDFLGVLRIKYNSKKITCPFKSIKELRDYLESLKKFNWEKL